MLDAAARSNPGGRWWLKGDGCDLVSGLCESVDLKWSGDVDLGNGELQQSYKAYRELLDFYGKIVIGPNRHHSVITEQLRKCLQVMKEDKEFIVNSMILFPL